MQPRKSYGVSIGIALFVLVGATFCFGQQKSLNPADVITVFPPDEPTPKEVMIRSAMDLSSKQASAFWPIYQDYEREQSKLASCRTEVVEKYGNDYLTMSNEQANAMANRIFDCDLRVVILKKKYFKKFNKVLPAYTVVKFFQVEHRIDLLERAKSELSLLPPLPPTYVTTN